jgi:cytochrome c-type biogenesis protein CcmH
MIAFLFAAAVLLAVALALLSRPWWRHRGASTLSRQSLNAAIYRDQLVELERDRTSGQLPEADFELARSEIQRRLIEDAGDADAPMGVASGGRRTLLALLVMLPLAAIALYALFGNPAGLDAMARRDFSQADIDRMVTTLAAKLENEPDNFQGWAMLARSYKAMRRTEEAKRAYDKAWPLVQTDAALLSDYADLLAASNGGQLAGRPEELIGMALKVDPDHLQSLWLAGTAAFNRDDFGQAAAHWDHALKLLPPESDDARMLTGIIAEARQKQAAAKKGGKR